VAEAAALTSARAVEVSEAEATKRVAEADKRATVAEKRAARAETEVVDAEMKVAVAEAAALTSARAVEVSKAEVARLYRELTLYTTVGVPYDAVITEEWQDVM
jgi:hypothetical protein